MSRRKLTERQSALIKQRQQSRIQRRSRPAGKDTDESLLGPEQNGVVVANHGANLQVERDDHSVATCTVRQNLGDLVCGDRVLWRAGPDSGVVVALYPRDTELVRTDVRGTVQIVAANIDRIFVVIAPVPEVSTNLLDNYLVAAELSRITPVILVNKSDVIGTDVRESWQSAMDVYRRCGYAVHFVSTRDPNSADQLSQLFSGHRAIVVGHSGVGKSSLLRRVLPGQEIAVGEVSVAGLGKHTTTVARLYHLPGGGHIIDSPGVREFRLGYITEDQAVHGFVEFRPWLGQCKFRDCRHTVEPGCAIRTAVANGSIDERRHRHYVALLEGLKQQQGGPLT